MSTTKRKKILLKWLICTSFPNISIALRIMLTVPITTASADRSFKKLKITDYNGSGNWNVNFSIENEV